MYKFYIAVVIVHDSSACLLHQLLLDCDERVLVLLHTMCDVLSAQTSMPSFPSFLHQAILITSTVALHLSSLIHHDCPWLWHSPFLPPSGSEHPRRFHLRATLAGFALITHCMIFSAKANASCMLDPAMRMFGPPFIKCVAARGSSKITVVAIS